MKVLMRLPVLLALVIGSQAQTQSPKPAPLTILGCHWTRASRSQGSSGDQEKKAKDAATDQQIALANRETEDSGGQSNSGEAQNLEERKRSQVALIPLPGEAVKGYLYEVEVRNEGDKTIKRLQWSYVFTDVLTQKEIVRHEFISQTSIPPAHDKKVSAFTRGSPPAVINVKELSKTGNKAWGEAVVIESVEFADRSIWKRLQEKK